MNRSGKYYNAVHYSVDNQTEQIDYDAVAELARIHRPRFIIAGYSSYPWAVNWARFREIADAVSVLRGRTAVPGVEPDEARDRPAADAPARRR